MKKLLIGILFIFISFTSMASEKAWVKVQEPLESYEFFEYIHCVDSNDCYAVSRIIGLVRFYKSTDQGKTWFEYSVADEIFSQAGFSKVLNGNYILFTDWMEPLIYISQDSGKTYREIIIKDSTEDGRKYIIKDISLYSDSISVFHTYDEIVFTKDNWYNYVIVDTPDSINVSGPIYFIDSNNIVFKRRNEYDGEFVKYNILQNSFESISRLEKVGNEFKEITAIDFVNDTLGFGGGIFFYDGGNSPLKSALVWKTVDGGLSWNIIFEERDLPYWGFRDIAFNGALNGIAVGALGNIYETKDGGENWFRHPHQDFFDSTSFPVVAFAGSIALLAEIGNGFYRLESISNVEEIPETGKFRAFNTNEFLYIAILDESYKDYLISVFDATGTELLSTTIRSSPNTLYEPISIASLKSGTYFLTFTDRNNKSFATHKFQVIK